MIAYKFPKFSIFPPKNTILEVLMKKILLAMLCAALLMSCASKRAAMVDPSLAEAKYLQALAKVNGMEPNGLADALITAADNQKEKGQTEASFILAYEAILQFQLALQMQENYKMADSLAAAVENLGIYRSALEERRSARGK
jgi:opacity protein-like surface antigen